MDGFLAAGGAKSDGAIAIHSGGAISALEAVN